MQQTLYSNSFSTLLIAYKIESRHHIAYRKKNTYLDSILYYRFPLLDSNVILLNENETMSFICIKNHTNTFVTKIPRHHLNVNPCVFITTNVTKFSNLSKKKNINIAKSTKILSYSIIYEWPLMFPIAIPHNANTFAVIFELGCTGLPDLCNAQYGTWKRMKTKI